MGGSMLRTQTQVMPKISSTTATAIQRGKDDHHYLNSKREDTLDEELKDISQIPTLDTMASSQRDNELDLIQ